MRKDLEEAKDMLSKTMIDDLKLQDDKVMYNLCGALARFADSLNRIEDQLDGLTSGLRDLSSDVKTIKARSRR